MTVAIAPTRPGAGSAVLRGLLCLGSLTVLVGMPENLAYWDEPGASVVPTERTMPGWGNYLVAVALGLGTVLLVAGWFTRQRRRPQPWWARSVAAVAGVVLVLWVASLLASQILSLVPDGGAIGVGLGPAIFVDALLAGLGTAVVALMICDPMHTSTQQFGSIER